jgi:hypothetical protein
MERMACWQFAQTMVWSIIYPIKSNYPLILAVELHTMCRSSLLTVTSLSYRSLTLNSFTVNCTLAHQISVVVKWNVGCASQIKLIHSHFNLVTVNSNPCFIHSTDQASLLRLYTSSEVWIDCNYVKESNLLVQSNWWHGFFECVLQILGTEVSTQLLSFRPLVTKTCSRITNLILP